MADLASLIIKIDARDVNRSRDDLGRLTRAGTSAEQGLSSSAKNISGSFGTMGSAIKSAIASLALFQSASSLIDTERQARALGSTFSVAASSAQQAAAQMAYVRSEADRLGLDLATAAKSFASFEAASKGTALAGRGAADVFSAVSEASLVLGLSAERTEGALTALQQMVSKGVVSAEELRGQLGERLPGAFQLAARAMGMTTAELGKQLQLGNIMAEDMLPKLARELRANFSEAAKTAGDSLSANMNRGKTAVFELQDAINKAGAADMFNGTVKGGTFFLQVVAQAIKANAEFAASTKGTAASGESYWRAFSERTVQFFARIPDFVKTMSVLIINDMAYAATAIGLGFKAMAVLAERAFEGLKGAVGGALAFILDQVASTYQLAESALRGMGANDLADTYRDAAKSVSTFSDVVRNQHDENIAGLDRERDAIVAQQADASKLRQSVGDQAIEEMVLRDQARESAILQAGAIKKVGLETLEQGKASAKGAEKADRLAKSELRKLISDREKAAELRNFIQLVQRGISVTEADSLAKAESSHLTGIELEQYKQDIQLKKQIIFLDEENTKAVEAHKKALEANISVIGDLDSVEFERGFLADGFKADEAAFLSAMENLKALQNAARNKPSPASQSEADTLGVKIDIEGQRRALASEDLQRNARDNLADSTYRLGLALQGVYADNANYQASVFKITEEIGRLSKGALPGAEAAAAALGMELEKLNTDRITKIVDDLNEADKLSNQLKGMDISSVFGAGFGNPFEAALTGVADLISASEEYAKSREQLIASHGKDSKEVKLLDSQNAIATVGNLAKMAKSSQDFFKRGTTGYKTMQVASKVFSAIELALQIKSAVVNAATVASKIAANATLAASNAITAITGAAVGLGPAGFITGALMAAAMAALGVATGAFGGSGSGSAGQSAEERQATQGTGSVLGDSKAKNEGLVNALKILVSLQESGLNVSGAMLQSLRNIEASFRGVTNLLFRANTATGGATPFNVETTKKGGPLSSSILLGAIFGSTTTKQIDTGIQFAGAELGTILSNGITGTYYATMEKTKKSLFGLVKKTSTFELTQGLGTEASKQFTMILGGISGGILDAIDVLGLDVDAAKAKLMGTFVNLGKISLQGMSTEDVQKAMEAVFGNASDSLVRGVLPEIAKFQNVGEGLFETLIRVASQTHAINGLFDAMGKGFDLAGLAAATAVQGLIDAAGGFDALQSSLAFFYDKFYSDSERTAATAANLTSAFGGLGYALPASAEAFRSLVNSIDISTTGGQQLYTSLLSLAPAFSKVTAEIDKIAAASAALDIRLLNATGDSAGAQSLTRAAELASTNESLRPKLEAIYAAEDQSAAAKLQMAAAQKSADAAKALEVAAQKSKEAAQGAAKSLREFVSGMWQDQSIVGELAAFGESQNNLMRLVALARTGDLEAAGKLPAAAGDVMKLSAGLATSREDLIRTQAMVASLLGGVAATLDPQMQQVLALQSIDRQTLEAIEGGLRMESLARSTLDVLGVIARGNPAANGPDFAAPMDYSTNGAAGIDAASNSDVAAEVAALREDMRAAMSQVAQNTGQVARFLRSWDDGDRMNVSVVQRTGEKVLTKAVA